MERNKYIQKHRWCKSNLNWNNQYIIIQSRELMEKVKAITGIEMMMIMMMVNVLETKLWSIGPK